MPGYVEDMNSDPAHTPSPFLFDRTALRARQDRARRTGDVASFLLERVADEIGERLSFVLRDFGTAIDLGTPLPTLAERLADLPSVQEICRITPLPERLSDRFMTVQGDEELVPLKPQSANLIATALSLHMVNDLPGTLIQCARSLKPDGLLFVAMLGGQTLFELRNALAVAEAEVTGGISPRVAPFADVRDAGGLLQRAGLALPVTDMDRVTVRYDNLFSLMADLRRMGATNVLRDRLKMPTRRSVFLRAAQIYHEKYGADDGRIPATFDILYLSGWAPHESQQKPLRPGSAKARLADALGTTERSTGEKAGQ